MKLSPASAREGLSGAQPAKPRDPAETSCPACGTAKTEEFFHAPDVPVFCNVAFETAAEARRAPRGDIRLRICRSCGYIYNAAFVGELLSYAPGYENAQHFSDRFRLYVGRLAADLVDRLGLRGRRIIEIGCGDGYFLSLLCRMGGNSGVGFDPSHRPEDAPAPACEDVSFRSECYGPAHAQEPVDLICCRHVLEHVAEPLRFLRQLREIIGARANVDVYFEVPNAAATLSGAATWDVLYEHRSYFVAPALRRLFCMAGFEPVSCWAAYDGQFLAILAGPAPIANVRSPKRPSMSGDLVTAARSFADRFHKRVSYWQRFLRRLSERSKRIVFWQAGSRGVTLLNALDRSERLVPYVVDVSPRKQGRFIPGSAQQIVAPGFLRQWRPAAAVVMNCVYLAEIGNTLARLGVEAKLLVA